MNFREHLFWALVSFSLSLVIFTVTMDYNELGIGSYAFLFAVMAISVVCNEAGNAIVSRENKRKREEKKEKQPVEKKEEKIPVYVYRIITYSCLGILIVFTVYVCTPASDLPHYIIGGFSGAFFGSHIPDLDKTITGDIRFHRNPVTHSMMLSIPLAVSALLMIDDIHVSLVLLFIGVLIGNASHLLSDNFESEGTLADLFVDKNFVKTCPGDIRYVKEERQRLWLNTQAIFGLGIVVFMYCRFDLMPALSGLFVWAYYYDYLGFSLVARVLIYITVAYYGLSVLAMVLWRKKPKKKQEKRKKVEKPVQKRQAV